MIARYIPYIQTNFVFGLDADEGRAPFELTKRYIDMSPSVCPGYSLLTAFGQAAPLNLDYQREGRILPFPFHFLNNHLAMNVRPLNYSWTAFYDLVIETSAHTWRPKALFNRFRANNHWLASWMNLIRAISAEGYGRLRHFRTVRRLLDEDRQFRDYYEGNTRELPRYYLDRMKKDLGDLWHWLPEGAIYHDPHAYLKEETANAVLKNRTPDGRKTG
jgi:hypothetical protein